MTETQFKVLKLKLIKPLNMDWDKFGRLIRDARYRVYRLANLAVSERYLHFHLWRAGKSGVLAEQKASELNKRLRAMMIEEAKDMASKKAKAPEPGKKEPPGLTPEETANAFSKTGALPDTVSGALFMYKIKGLTSDSKWKDVIRGNSALPTFRNTMAIPIRCDKPYQRRLEKLGNGDVALDLMICNKPYPRVLLGTGGIGEGAEAVVARLLGNPSQGENGYKQRCFEVKEDETHTWWVYVCYSLPAPEPAKLDAGRIVGVDVGYGCPVYAALSNGHARLGYRAFSALAARVKSLKFRTIRRRKDIQRGGRTDVSGESARSGHGRSRKLQGVEKLQGKINRAYTTLNHQMSAAVVSFARDNGAGTIQMEDLSGLRDQLSGTFLGLMWRYHQLQEFITYKAKEAGIQVRQVDPRYTSRRCSKCGHINFDFTRQARDRAAKDGYAAKFKCVAPGCDFESDADYNAARNLAVADIDGIIRNQCEAQGHVLSQLTEAAGKNYASRKAIAGSRPKAD